MIIDFHTHTFPSRISSRVIDLLSRRARIAPFSDGSMEGLLDSMKEAGVDYSVHLPVITDVGQVEKINSSYIEQREELLEKGIVAFGGIHPDYEDIQGEIRRLARAGIAGIKLHPAYFGIDLDDTPMLRIIEAAAMEDLVILTHAGIDIGIYDHNYASTDQILTVIDKIGPKKMVLAHFGNWGCWDMVEKYLAGAPVWFDLAFSLGDITPRPGMEEKPIRSFNLSDEDVVRISRKHGTDRILFATDSPWSSQKEYVNKVKNMAFTPREQDMILGENARLLLHRSGSRLNSS